MSHTAKKKLTTFVCLGLAAALIAGGVFSLSSLLSHATASDVGVVHSEPLDATVETPRSEAELPQGLTTIIYLQGKTLPAEAVSAQYAIALTDDIVGRVFGEQLTGRVMCRLSEANETMAASYAYSLGVLDGLFWEVTAELENGLLSVNVNATTGVEFMVRKQESNVESWASYFDSWNEEAAEADRLAWEQERVAYESDPQFMAQQEQYNAAEARRIAGTVDGQSQKSQAMAEYAASMAASPLNAQAVELANTLGLGYGAQAVSGAIYMQGSGKPVGGMVVLTTLDDGTEVLGSENYIPSYLVELTLDDGSFLTIELAEDGTLLHYERTIVSVPKMNYNY